MPVALLIFALSHIPALAVFYPVFNPRMVNGVRHMNRYATGGQGTLADPWTGWEAGCSGANALYFPAGNYRQTTLCSFSGTSATDRQGRFHIWGDGLGATNIIARLAPAWKFTQAGGSQPNYGGIYFHDITFLLDQNLWWDHGIIELERSLNWQIERIDLLGGTVNGTGLEFNTYAGWLLELDGSYEGKVSDVHTYGRYLTPWEIDDPISAEEIDSITFSNTKTKGPIGGIIRTTTAGVHNLSFINFKYQTNIEVAADTNQYDETLLNGSVSAGVTSLVVDSSAAFAVDDPVLIDVGDLLELNKVSAVPDGTHLTLARATRFAHADNVQVLHGGVGVGFSAGTSRLMTFINPMFEQCASGVMTDAAKWLHMVNVESSCKEIIQVVGPHSTGGTVGLWNATIDGAELNYVSGATDIYGVRVKTSGDSSNNREIELRHIKLNSSSNDTLIVLQNDAATNRNFEFTGPLQGNSSASGGAGGNMVKHRFFSSGIGATTPVDSIYRDGTLGFSITSEGGVAAKSFTAAQHATNGGCLDLYEGVDDGTNLTSYCMPNSGLSSTNTYTADATGKWPAAVIQNDVLGPTQIDETAAYTWSGTSTFTGTLTATGATSTKPDKQTTDCSAQTSQGATCIDTDDSVSYQGTGSVTRATVTNPASTHAGVPMWGDSDDTTDTGNEVCALSGMTCVDVKLPNGTDSDCTTDQGTAGTYFYALCRKP